jgi:hypothetical protein
MRIAAMAFAAILLSTGSLYAQPAPAQRSNAPTTAAPSSAAQPAPAQRGTAPTTAAPGNAAPGNAGQFKTEADAKSHCSTGDVVWMNLDSHVYHLSSAKEFGHTKHGAYMCQADAEKIGRAAKDEKPKKKG